jgi:ATP-dependent DNA helicase RecG
MELTALKGIGAKLAEKFTLLGITSVEELLLTFPRTYLDYSKVVTISELRPDEPQTFKATAVSAKNIFLRNRAGKTMQQATLQDESGKVQALWFNMPYIAETLGEGGEFYFVGKLRLDKQGKPQLNSPTFEKASAETLHTARIVPVYSLTRGLSPKVYRRALKTALKYLGDLEISHVPEKYYQQGAIEKLAAERIDSELPPFREALEQIHFPDSQPELDAARLRLSIEELVPIQLKLLQKAKLRAQSKSLLPLKPEKTDQIAEYWGKLPFEPTEGQLQACQDILQDFESGRPAYRLVQGDVGTGKTAVAGFAAWLTLRAGFDTVLLAPTTILADQHYKSFWRIFAEQTMILTSADQSALRTLGKAAKSRKPVFVVATQALLHHHAEMNLKIGTVIVDEEHRFGVKQREVIAGIWQGERAGAKLPHYYSLTATPIPRSLALSIFGNIDFTRISAPPAGRKPKLTYMVPEAKRSDSYGWLREHLEQGEKVFWVCPLIEKKSEVDNLPVLLPASEKATVEAKAQELATMYAEYPVGKLHGKLKAASKQKILNDFAAGKIKLLVSTTVIEVGIDIPDANLIVIESADSFGLAQLHQLRGRVGRGGGQGICLVYGDSERLRTFSHEQDGLKLAEYDLSLRGPGEVYGKIQSGIPNLKLASLTDPIQIAISRKIAEDVNNL